MISYDQNNSEMGNNLMEDRIAGILGRVLGETVAKDKILPKEGEQAPGGNLR